MLSAENLENWMITSTKKGVLQMMYQPTVPAEISPAVIPASISSTWRLPLLMHSSSRISCKQTRY